MSTFKNGDSLSRRFSIFIEVYLRSYHVVEPLMKSLPTDHFLHQLFGLGKGSGAAFLFFMIGIGGVCVCLLFRKDKYIWRLESNDEHIISSSNP